VLVFHGVGNRASSSFVHNARHPVKTRVACTLAVSAEERPAAPRGRDGSGNKNERLIHGRARKWLVVVLNLLADRVKWVRAAALTAHVALSKEPNF
jgi:hypothetical protein